MERKIQLKHWNLQALRVNKRFLEIDRDEYLMKVNNQIKAIEKQISNIITKIK